MEYIITIIISILFGITLGMLLIIYYLFGANNRNCLFEASDDSLIKIKNDKLYLRSEVSEAILTILMREDLVKRTDNFRYLRTFLTSKEVENYFKEILELNNIKFEISHT